MFTFLKETGELVSIKPFSLLHMSEMGYLEWSLFGFFLIQCWWVDEAVMVRKVGERAKGYAVGVCISKQA